MFAERTRLLHVAAEHHLGSLLARQPHIKYVSGDLFNPAMVKLDVRKLPFRDGAFDVVICNHVLEHVVEDLDAMRELRRVLRIGGWAVLQVPIGLALATTLEDRSVGTDEEREARFGQRDHVRVYGQDYPQRLEAAGFRVSVDAFTRELGREAERFGLDPREPIYLART